MPILLSAGLIVLCGLLLFIVVVMSKIVVYRIRLAIANRYLRRGDHVRAIPQYCRLVVQGPSPSVLRLRGIAYGTAGRHDLALADFDEAIRMNPKFALGYVERGIAKGVMGDLPGATNDLDAALALEPGSHLALVNRAWIKRLKGDYNGALTDFSRAAELLPGYAEAWAGACVIQFHLGNRAEAFRNYERAKACGVIDKDLEALISNLMMTNPVHSRGGQVDPM